MDVEVMKKEQSGREKREKEREIKTRKEGMMKSVGRKNE